RLVRADSPVVDDVHVGAALFEGPHAATHEIAERFDGEAVRLSVLDHAKLPFERVRQPTFRVKTHDATDGAEAAGLRHFDFEVHAVPPPSETGRVAEHVRDFLDGARHRPLGDKVIIVRAHARGLLRTTPRHDRKAASSSNGSDPSYQIVAPGQPYG